MADGKRAGGRAGLVTKWLVLPVAIAFPPKSAGMPLTPKASPVPMPMRKVAQRLECGAFRRFRQGFVNSPGRPRRRQDPI